MTAPVCTASIPMIGSILRGGSSEFEPPEITSIPMRDLKCLGSVIVSQCRQSGLSTSRSERHFCDVIETTRVRYFSFSTVLTTLKPYSGVGIDIYRSSAVEDREGIRSGLAAPTAARAKDPRRKSSRVNMRRVKWSANLGRCDQPPGEWFCGALHCLRVTESNR